MSQKNTFKCALCKDEYLNPPEEEWSEEVRLEEFRRLHPGENMSQKDIAIVCDDCHNRVIEWRKTNMPGGMLQ